MPSIINQRIFMKFCQYIKHCRQKYNLTQEDLVEYLYNFDVYTSYKINILSNLLEVYQNLWMAKN